jgi:hypothetical protein
MAKLATNDEVIVKKNPFKPFKVAEIANCCIWT